MPTSLISSGAKNASPVFISESHCYGDISCSAYQHLHGRITALLLIGAQSDVGEVYSAMFWNVALMDDEILRQLANNRQLASNLQAPITF